VCAQLGLVLVVEAFYWCFLDLAFRPLHLASGLGVVGSGVPVCHPVGVADHVEEHRPGGDCVAIYRLLGDLNTIIHYPAVAACHNERGGGT